MPKIKPQPEGPEPDGPEPEAEVIQSDVTPEPEVIEPEWVDATLTDALRWEPVWIKAQATHPKDPAGRLVRIGIHSVRLPVDLPVMRRRRRVQ